MTLAERQRFHRYVERQGHDECWPWTRANAGGYGRIKIRDRLFSAHRIAYTLAFGPIPRGPGFHGYIVMHSCDNPSCCNPAHLRLGTAQDNVQDMLAKGRAAPRKGTRFPPELIQQIKESPLSQRQAAKVFGVSARHIGWLRKQTQIQPNQIK